MTDPGTEAKEVDEWILACRTLEASGVRYLIVGAFGAELHFLRDVTQILTRDMDLLVPQDASQVLRALLVLRSAGFFLHANGEEVIPDEVIAAGVVRQFATVRASRGKETIDIMTFARGMAFDELWAAQHEYMVRGVRLRVAPLAAIIRSKKEAGRMKDRLFLEQFKEMIGEALDREKKRSRKRPLDDGPHDSPPA